MMKKQHITFFLLVFFVAGGLWSLSFFFAPHKVPATHATRGTAAELVYATGVVEPLVNAALGAEVAGRLTSLDVNEMAVVQKGQTLATLDSSKEQALLAEAKAKLEKARRDFERAKALFEKKSGSQEAYDNARTALLQAGASVISANEDITKRTIKAPFDGMITRKEGDVGDFIPQGQKIFDLAQQGGTRVTLDVDEEDIAQVKNGQTVLLTADAFPGKVISATLSEITPQGDSTNKSYRVRATLPADAGLPLGMTVEANIILTQKQNALLVPTTALSASGDLFLIKDHRAVKMHPTLGIRGLEKTEVLDTLQEGDVVAISPEGLIDKSRARADISSSSP